jgi:hypothetical protein
VNSQITRYDRWAAGSLFLVVFFVYALHFRFGAWFLGWDSLASELNPALNLWRNLTSTWQSYQGLGLLGGHGYQAQLVHSLLQFVLSFFIPTSYLRLVFSFLMSLCGVIGAYFLMRSVIHEDDVENEEKITSVLISWLVALTYFLHFGSVQTFYFMLEPFAVMFGLLPISILTLTSLTAKPTKTRWGYWWLCNVGLSVIGFIPPVFISYVLFLSLYSLAQLVIKRSVSHLFLLVKVGLVVMATNLFWLLPLLVFSLTQSNYYLESQLNKTTTPLFQKKSDYYGTLGKVALLHSFYFDSYDQQHESTTDTSQKALEPWIDHQDKIMVKPIGYLLFFLGLFGTVFSLFLSFKNKKPSLLLAPILFVISFVLLARDVVILREVNRVIEVLPLLGQAFRLPFSKIAMVMSLATALGLGMSLEFARMSLIRIVPMRTKNRLFVSLCGLYLLSLAWYSFPVFSSHLLYSSSLTTLPPEYQNAFSFIRKNQLHSRILHLPILTNTGWDMLKWPNDQSYTGSGFAWHAIDNPQAHRSFDVWSPYNETLRNEFFQAIYRKDTASFSYLADKYQIGMIWLDENNNLPDTSDDAFFYEEIKKSLADNSLTPVFSEKKLSIWTRENPDVWGEVTLVTNPNLVAELPLRQLAYPQLSLPSATNEKGGVFPFFEAIQHPENLSFFNETGTFRVKTSVVSSENQKIGISLTNNIPIPYRVSIVSSKNSRGASSRSLTLKSQLGTLLVNGSVVLNWEKPFLFPINPEVEKLEVGSKIIDAFALKNDEEIDYGVVNLDKNQLETIARAIGVPDNSELPKYAAEVPLHQGENILIWAGPSYEYTWDPDKISQSSGQKNCQVEGIGRANSQLDSDVLTLSASNEGIACQNIVFSDLPYFGGLLITAQTESNPSGLNGKITISDSILGIPQQSITLNDGTGTIHSIVPQFSDLKGTKILFDVSSLPGQESRATFRNVRLKSLPLDVFTSLKITRGSEEESSVTPLQFSTIGSGVYFGRVSSSFHSALVINQASDPHWVAFDQTLSFLPKTTINNWAQGFWVSDKTHWVIILFWPQLLHWIGLITLAFSGLYIFLKKQKA